MVTTAVRSLGVLPLLFTRKPGSESLRKYCIMHQSIPAAPSPPPPGYCGAFARLISPGGEAFPNFAPPRDRKFICQPQGYSQVFDTHAVSYQYKYKPPGGLYVEGRFNVGFFCVTGLGAYIWRGLYMERLIFGILRYNYTEDITGKKKKQISSSVKDRGL